MIPARTSSNLSGMQLSEQVIFAPGGCASSMKKSPFHGRNQQLPRPRPRAGHFPVTPFSCRYRTERRLCAGTPSSDRLSAKIPKLAEAQFWAVVQGLLNTPPMPMARYRASGSRKPARKSNPRTTGVSGFPFWLLQRARTTLLPSRWARQCGRCRKRLEFA
jgi:hypothetical protein